MYAGNSRVLLWVAALLPRVAAHAGAIDRGSAGAIRSDPIQDIQRGTEIDARRVFRGSEDLHEAFHCQYAVLISA